MKMQIKNGFVEIDEEDYQLLSQYSWAVNLRKVAKYGNDYATTNIPRDGKQITTQMHRLLMGVAINDKRVVDHINHDTLDNRKCNLRVCTRQQNCMNRKVNKNNKSGYVGVSFYNHTKKWRSAIGYKWNKIVLGYFSTPEEASAAYQEKAKELFGEFKIKETYE
jgi:hypothetical protein